MARYVALLRGINVGGKNLIRMPALQACFEDHGFADVPTYIQSGNVVFSAGRSSRRRPHRRDRVDAEEGFAHYDASVVLRSASQMRSVVDARTAGLRRRSRSGTATR